MNESSNDPVGEKLKELFGEGVRINPNYGYSIPVHVMTGNVLARTYSLLLFHKAGGGFQAYLQGSDAESVVAQDALNAIIGVVERLQLHQKPGAPDADTADE